jgi:fibronectin type 3 domain-containing protein
LQATSPCINAGTPDTSGLNIGPFDLDGNPRVAFGRIDMGAYESDFSVSPPSVPANLKAFAGNNSAVLYWQKNMEPNVANYNVYIVTSSGFDSLVNTTSDTIIKIFGLTNGNTYNFKVTAVATSGLESGYSNEANAKLAVLPILSIASFIPSSNALNVLPDVKISVTFDQTSNSSIFTQSTIRVYGSLSGFHKSLLSYNSSTRTLTIVPTTKFMPGDVATVTLNIGITNKTGGSQAHSFSWSFTVNSGTSLGKFINVTTVKVGDRPSAVAIGDWNGDGILDLATSNTGDYLPNNQTKDDSVSILTNNGNAIFQNTLVSVGNDPSSVIAGDWNGNGIPGLATTNWNLNMVNVLSNNGNGTFKGSSVEVKNNPVQSVTGDFDGDGMLDLAVAHWGSSNVSILWNSGSGKFIAGPSINLNGGSLQSITSGDFNGDGLLDLAVANGDSGYILIINNMGGGIFSLGMRINVGKCPISIISGDWNGDGFLDIAVANYFSNSVSILLNNGNGGFTTTTIKGFSAPRSIVSGDWNGDGALDLAVANLGSDSVTILLNNDKGYFTYSTKVSVGSSPNSIGAADLNGDGLLDLAVVNYASNTVSILLNHALIAPSNLTVTPGDSSVTLKWDKNTEYDFLRCRIYDSIPGKPKTKIDSTTNTTIIMTSLQNDTTYYFWVTALDIISLESGFSNEASTMPAVKPLIDSIKTNLCPGNTATLTVRDTVKLAKYVWYEDGQRLNENYSSHVTIPVYQRKYTVEDVTCKLVSDPAKISWSQVPNVPKIYSGGGPNVYYFATDTQNIKSYQWYRNDSLITGATKYYYVAYKHWGVYTVRISQVNLICPSFSLPHPLNDPDTSGNKNKSSVIDEFSIYPNPAGSELNVSMNTSYLGTLAFTISDLSGQVLLRFNYIKTVEPACTINIPLYNISQGYYLLDIRTGDETFKRMKFLKK